MEKKKQEKLHGINIMVKLQSAKRTMILRLSVQNNVLAMSNAETREFRTKIGNQWRKSRQKMEKDTVYLRRRTARKGISLLSMWKKLFEN